MLQRLLDARKKARAQAVPSNGFTLIELLIVIVILGVLAGVVVFAVSAFNDRGEEAACKADFKAVEVAVEAYRANEASYPASIGALVPEYLREEPSSPDCTIQIAADGTLTVSGIYNATSGGGGGGGGGPETSAPDAPGDVDATDGGFAAVDVSWDAPANDGGSPIIDYEVQRSSRSGNHGNCNGHSWTNPLTVTTTALTYEFTNLNSNTTYCFRVLARNSVGLSAPSGTARFYQQ